jgi:anti-anti-sigma factor
VLRVRKGEAGNDCRVFVEGRFTFDLYKEFLGIIDERSTNCDRLTVDLTRSDYMDSSALGMLIVMRERFPPTSTHTLCVKTGSAAEEILKVTRFEQMFDIQLT